MTTAEFVQNVVLASEGKLPTFVSGSTKWLRIVAQGNFYLQQFARERGVNWNRYYNSALPVVGTVTATDTFAIPATVRKISQEEGDVLRITHTDGVVSEYTFIPHDRLKHYPTGNYVSKIGSNLVFNSAFTSDSPQFGGTITFPVYGFPTAFSLDSDELDIDDPNWLVYVVAADRVKNDVTRKDLRADLISQANEAMQAMKDDNLSQLEEVNRTWNPTGHVTDDWLS